MGSLQRINDSHPIGFILTKMKNFTQIGGIYPTKPNNDEHPVQIHQIEPTVYIVYIRLLKLNLISMATV
jgi:hypothetical protein